METDFSKRLVAFRESTGKSQDVFCLLLRDKAGNPLKQRTYADYETGRSEPAQNVLKSLAELGCDVHWLITGEKQKGEITVDNSQIRSLELTLAKLEGKYEECSRDKNWFMENIKDTLEHCRKLLGGTTSKSTAKRHAPLMAHG